MIDRAFVSTRKGLFTIRRRGAAGTDWSIAEAAFVGDNVTLALPDPRDGAVYAALDHGHFGVKLHRSDDGGESWQEIAAPAFPPEPEGPPVLNSSGRHVPWTTKLVWALETGGPGARGDLWCGTIPGGLFRSSDRGDSWQLVESLWMHPARLEWFGGGADLPGIHSICVDPRDDRRVLVAVSCGGVWETRDSGATWSCRSEGLRAAYMPPDRAFDPVIQDPHHMALCAGSPDALWIQHHNGIFRSTDGAASWREIEDVSPSAFGFPVAVHPAEPDTAWFVPAVKDEKRVPVAGRFVLTRTRDGGRTFETLSRGLPQEHAYDIVFRHGLDVDASGQQLLVGSTTGSLWVSQDQGDAFSTVSQHLPPIYAIRFG